MNTIEKLFEEFKRQYKELEEENNRLKLEIIKLAVMQNMSNILKEKTDNKQNNEMPNFIYLYSQETMNITFGN